MDEITVERKSHGTAWSIIVIVAATVVLNVLVVAIPGFYSHDELQSIDYLRDQGLADYLRHAISLHAAERFSTPVRPVGFFVWGLFLVPAKQYPVLTHLFDVLLHAAVAVALFLVLRSFTGRARGALLAALLFSLSPLALFAVAWSGAIFDRLYVLFVLLSALSLFRFLHAPTPAGRANAGLCLILSAALAVFSKETAVIVPLLLSMAAAWLHAREPQIPLRRMVLGVGVGTLPIALYLILRMKPLLNSLMIPTGGSYDASLANVPVNVGLYFLYPFVAQLAESHTYFAHSRSLLMLGAVLHMLLMTLIVRRYGWRSCLFYLTGYVLFLLPVASIASSGSHYLYGSGLVLATAMAFLFDHLRSTLIERIVVIILTAVLSTHAVVIQIFFYNTGACQTRLLTSLESAALSLGPGELKKRISIVPEEFSPKHILLRAVHHRSFDKHLGRVDVTVADGPSASSNGSLVWTFDRACYVYPRQTEGR